jgi:hypothetical protein
VVYCLCILPLSAIRWTTFVQEATHGGVNYRPSAATLALEAICGLINVVLLLATKPVSRWFGRAMSPGRPPTISDPCRDERSTESCNENASGTESA